MSIESGRYIIINAQHRNSAFLPDPNDGTFLVGSHEHGVVGDEWNIKKFPNGSYSLANFVYKMSASADYRPEKGASVVGRQRERIWTIKEHGSRGNYTIATTNDELRWCLEDGWPETPITLHDAPPSDTRCQWIFQRIGPVDIAAAAQGAAKPEAAALKAEVARMKRELEVAREEVARANAVAAENVAKREKAEAEASRKTAEVEKAKRETAKAKERLARTLAELETARREVEQVKGEVKSHKSGQNVSQAAGGAVAGATVGVKLSGKVALVSYDYDRNEDNEMNLVEGEYIHQIEELDDGWWQGVAASDPNRTGLFPANYVEMVDNPTDAAKSRSKA